MKKSIKNVSNLLLTVLASMTLLASFNASAAPIVLSGTDCHVGINELLCVESPYSVGCGWAAYDMGYWHAMTLKSATSLTYVDKSQQFEVSVKTDGNKIAFAINAPQVKFQQLKTLVPAPGGPSASATASFVPSDVHAAGRLYTVTCSPGLNDMVEKNRAAETAEMDRLGPAGEWQDAQAASMGTLPIGTILELKKSINIEARDAAEIYLEQHGRVTSSQMMAVKLPYRFAFARFHPANNSFSMSTSYPEGMQLRVIAVEKQEYGSGGHEYILRFETLTKGIQDPITWMSIDGRRAGSFDTKIPQFAELIGSDFSVVLP